MLSTRRSLIAAIAGAFGYLLSTTLTRAVREFRHDKKPSLNPTFPRRTVPLGVSFGVPLVRPRRAISGVDFQPELRRAFQFSLPGWRAIKLADVLHALRLWTDWFPRPDRFGVSQGGASWYTLQDYEDLLLRQSGPVAEQTGFRGYFCRTPFGIGVRQELALRGSVYGCAIHRDDLLAACAIRGLDLRTPIGQLGQPTSGYLRDLLLESLASFDKDTEIEWTAIAYTEYLTPISTWHNSRGEQFCFDDLAQCLVRRSRQSAACLGLHVPYALCCILNANRCFEIIRSATQSAIEAFLRDLSTKLEARQSNDGVWPGSLLADSRSENAPSADEVLTINGHHLEWLSIAPYELRPCPESIVTAIRACDRILTRLSFTDSPRVYCPITHYARGLGLLCREGE